MFSCSRIAKRNFSQSLIRYHGDHHYGRPGCPGQNFPLDFEGGKYKITAIFIAYFGIGLGAPWLVVMHQMTRK